MEMKEQILTIAQQLVQQRGFNGFSYADIAAEVGIRKASLHHHFPSKTDLGIALIDEYTRQIDQACTQIDALDQSAEAKLRRYVALFKGSLETNRMCMGGMLASEWLTLDASMLPGIQRFFARNTAWLAKVLAAGEYEKAFLLNGSADEHARLFLAALEGALLIARATGDHDGFDLTTSRLIADLGSVDR